jgi:hypothetical protein
VAIRHVAARAGRRRRRHDLQPGLPRCRDIFPVGIVSLVAAAASNTPGAWERRYARQCAVAFVVAVGVLLCAVRNIHGPALLAGLAITIAVYRRPGVTTVEQSEDAGKRPTSGDGRRYAHQEA